MTVDERAIAPTTIGGYRITRELAAGRTYAAADASGRPVVLKQLGADCLLHGRDGLALHSQIRDRLAAIRELAHPAIAHLYAVERDGTFVFMVWEHLDGQPFDDWAASPDQRQIVVLARELVLAVEGLHALGVVHGCLHARNIFVRDGRLRLTDVSPLLYTDVREDAVAIERMLADIVLKRGENETAFGQLVMRAEQEQMPLADLATALAVQLDPRSPAPVKEPAEELTPRGRSLTAAIVVALVGILVAWALWQYSVSVRDEPLTPPQAIR